MEPLSAPFRGRGPAVVFAVLVAAAAACAPAERRPFPNLIRDGDFEAGTALARPDRWRFEPPGAWALSDRSTGGGRHSLFVNAARIGGDASAGASAFARLGRLEPGASYVVEGRFRRDADADGAYPIVRLAGRRFRLSDLWTVDRWQKIALVVTVPRTQIPPAWQGLEIRVDKGEYGLWIDDLSVRRIGIEALADGGGQGGPPRLEWSFPLTDRLIDFSVVFKGPLPDPRESGWTFANARTGDDPGFERLGADEETSVERFAFRPLACLPAGRWRWRIEARLNRTLLAASRSGPFVVEDAGAAAPPAGAPQRSGSSAPPAPAGTSFPIGIYGATEADFPKLAAAGFDMVHTESGTPERLTRAIEKARAAGLGALVSPAPVLAVGRLDSFIGSRLALAVSEAPTGREEARPPGPGAGPVVWYLDDEPEGRSVPPRLIAEKRAALRRLGLLQPGAIALNRAWRARDYAPAVDIILSDPYPVPFEPLSWLGDCLDEIRAAVAGDPDKRVWAVIQAFPWNAARRDVAASGLGRAPTPAELRALVYLALVHRAQGLFFYAYRTGETYVLESEPALWQAVRDAVSEVRSLRPLILAPEAAGAATVECADRDRDGVPAIHFIVKDAAAQPGGAPTMTIIAVNALDEPVAARFVFRGGKRPPVEARFGPLEVKRIELE